MAKLPDWRSLPTLTIAGEQMKRISLLAVIASAVAAAPAHAVRPSYSSLDVAYLHTEFETIAIVGGPGGTTTTRGTGEATGMRLALNYSLTRWFFFTAGHDIRDVKDEHDLNLYDTSVGFGLHSLNSNFQLFATGTYERMEESGEERSSSLNPRIYDREEGFGVSLGGRLPVGIAELQADYKYFNYGDLPNGRRFDEDRYRFGALVHLTPRFALTGSYEMFEQAENTDSWTIGLRTYFDNRHDKPRKRKKRGPTPPPPPASAE